MSGPTSAGDVPIDGQGLSEDRVRLILGRRVAAAAGRAATRRAGVAVLVCLIGGERFAVPLAAVAEVLPATPPVRVPTAPASLAGLIVRRGAVFNLLDPSATLGVASRDSAHVLLLRGPVPRLALRIDEALVVGEALVPADAVEAGGTAGSDPGGGLTETLFLADGARVELIAVERLVAALGHSERIGTT